MTKHPNSVWLLMIGIYLGLGYWWLGSNRDLSCYESPAHLRQP